MSKADILSKAVEYEELHGGCDERDYGVIDYVADNVKYIELSDRPGDWSEEKVQLGKVGRSSSNPNIVETLGRRGKRGWAVERVTRRQ